LTNFTPINREEQGARGAGQRIQDQTLGSVVVASNLLPPASSLSFTHASSFQKNARPGKRR
jgi:hypothetical protein